MLAQFSIQFKLLANRSAKAKCVLLMNFERDRKT